MVETYGNTISKYEDNESVEIIGDKLKVNGTLVSEYTFKKDYYFMMGDNRHNTDDSRFWGFVPEDHIIGKAVMIWFSFDKYGTFFNKIRWKRFFKLIK